MTKPSVLFVCLGNICRSPLAEAAFRAAAQAAGLEAEADSAGTASYHVGSPPDPRSIAKAAEKGMDIRHYRGRQVEQSDFTRFTHILALDQQNLRNLQAIAPDNASAHLGLLLDMVPGREGEAVPDPYYGGPEGFELTWADVSAAARELVAQMLDA